MRKPRQVSLRTRWPNSLISLTWRTYKATIKGLTQFGDRRQGTERNRKAVDWIEAQLKSYGCTNTERIKYHFTEPAERDAPAAPRRHAPAAPQAQGGARRGIRAPLASTRIRWHSPTNAARPQCGADARRHGPREEVYCTKVGTTHPDEMYIVGAHMDGHGWGEAANDDGSGTALVMELARIFSSPDVQTERSIRFALWNNEETGLNGARAYVEQREDLQGKEDPPGRATIPSRNGSA